jgi:uncharacterized protein YchJ
MINCNSSSCYEILIPVESATNCDININWKCLVYADKNEKEQLEKLLPIDNRKYITGKPIIKGNLRNIKCSCGSGKKFKKCCMLKDNK